MLFTKKSVPLIACQIYCNLNVSINMQHNRIHEGRAMRVQLRDCNPPRHNWKYNRGRGRPHLHHFNGQKRVNNYRPHFNAHDRYPPQTTIEGNAPFQDANMSTVPLSSQIQDTEKLEEVLIMDPPTSPLDLSSAARESPPSETYREWYEAAESPTPAPSSLGSSVSTAGVPLSTPSYPYSPPNGAYFPPVQWMNPYPPPGPYQMPYYTGGYAIYPPGIPPQSQVPLASPPGSDAGGPAGIQPGWPPVGMYTVRFSSDRYVGRKTQFISLSVIHTLRGSSFQGTPS